MPWARGATMTTYVHISPGLYMWTSKKVLLSAGAAAMLCAALVILLFSYRDDSESKLALCHKATSDTQQIECIFRAIEQEILDDGMSAGMVLFSRAYADFPPFVAQGCHKQAHRVGDIVYARLYTSVEGIDALDFPQETTACGYGFFHGFLEHLIQDRPDPAFVDSVCSRLDERLGGEMQAIRSICFHGSGHGFALAHAETLPRSAWGNVREFTVDAAAMCDMLAQADERSVEECKEGVFNVLVEWMSLDQYGFALNRKHPFSSCDSGPKNLRSACYYEMAQKLDGLADRDPIKLATIVADISDAQLRRTAFQVGIAGIVQNTLQDVDATEKILSACATLEDEFFKGCLESYIHGLFEHGAPQKEYTRALDVCRLDVIIAKGYVSQCYHVVMERLPRFYSQDQQKKICALFPSELQEDCKPD
ncbi:MAG: hypothetical protein Athens041674_3 [Parcubacteria group bacterium Athens0416_74]|nr:MAG: hypothetical protein Athens041674_3 [Parcubacteria group bacterium Athens0416_74]